MTKIIEFSDGKDTYEVPESEAEAFASSVPNARRMTDFVGKDGSRYAVPEDEAEAFRSSVADVEQVSRFQLSGGQTYDVRQSRMSKFLRSRQYREGDADAIAAKRAEIDAATPKSLEQSIPGAIAKGAFDTAEAALKGGTRAAGKIAGALTGIVTGPLRQVGMLFGRNNALVKGMDWIDDKFDWFAEDLGVGLSSGDKTQDVLSSIGEIGSSAAANLIPWLVGGGAASKIAGKALFAANVMGAGGRSATDMYDQVKADGGDDAAAYKASLAANAASTAAAFVFGKLSLENYLSGIGAKGAAKLIESEVKTAGKGFNGIVKAVANGNMRRDIAKALVGGAEEFATEGAESFVLDVLRQNATKDEVDFEEAALTALKDAAVGGLTGAALGGIRATEGMKLFRGTYEKQARAEVSQLMNDMAPGDIREMNPKAFDAIAKKRARGEAVSRKDAEELGLPPSWTQAERNEVFDEYHQEKAAQRQKSVKMDGVQEQALKDTVKEFVGDDPIAQKVYDRVAMDLKDAKVLDDPDARERLVMKAAEAVQKEDLKATKQEVKNETRTNEAPKKSEQAAQPMAGEAEATRPVETTLPPAEVGGAVVTPKTAPKAPTSASTESKVNTPPMSTESAEGGPRAADAVSTPTKPKTVKEGKAFVNSNIGKRYTDGKKTYEITGLTKDGEVSIKVTDKKGNTEENSLRLSGALTRIFGTKKAGAVWSEVKTPETEQKSPNRTKTTAKTPNTEQKVPKTEDANKKTARVDGKAEAKRNESGSKAEVKKPTKPLKANPKKAAEVVKEFVSKDATRSYVNRIHHDHDSGLAVATNGSILIATKHGYDPNYKDDSRNPYPNWRQVVPIFKKGEGQTITIDPNAVLEATKTVKKLASGIKSDNMIRIKLPNGGHTYMSVNTLSRVAKAMAANGITEITTEGPFKPLLAKNNDTTIVAMPLRNGDGDVKLGRNAETKIVTFDLESGKVISAPESKIGKMRRGFAEKLRTDIAEGRAKEIEWLRTTELYKGLIAAQKKGETDAKKVYEGITREEGSWGELSEANQKLFAELLATKDIAELENRFSEYSAKMRDSKKKSPRNDWVERTPKELAKLEKEIAAEDAIDAMMADAEPKTAPKSEPKGETKAEVKEESETKSKSEVKEPQSSLDAYISGKKPMEAARIRKILTKQINYGNGGVMTEVEYVEKAKSEGNEINAFYQMSDKSGKGKVLYSLKNGGILVSKTAVDYARFIGMKVDENSILRAEESIKLKEAQSRSEAVSKPDYSASDENIEKRIGELAKKRLDYRPDMKAEYDVLNEIKSARIKRGDWSLKPKVETNSETAPSITPAEAMRKLGFLGAADVNTLSKALTREERAGHTERANMIRVLRDYKKSVGTNPDPQSDVTEGGKYRASVEEARPLDDPAFKAWAKKRGVAPTTQKRNEYDKVMADTLKNRLSRWIKGVSVKTVNFIAPEEGGDVRAAKKYSRAGTVAQRVKKNERGVFRQELATILANYAHNNNGEYPKSCGLFTSDAYYIFDIIDGSPVNIHRMSLNERNREKIKAFDKKYKREIYRGARSAAGWVDWIETKHVGVLSGDNGVVGNKGADGSLLDGSGSKEGRGLSFERVGAEKNLGGEEGSGASSEAKNQTVYLHDGERIVGSYNRATGEVKLAKGASVETVLHELGWHAARHWSEVNADSDPKAKSLLEQMKKYAESAPTEIKDAVRDVYGDLDADTLLDEIGAARFTKEQSGKIAEALATKEGAAWYQKVLDKVVDLFKNFLTKIGYNRVDLDGIENMSPEVFGDFLADVMMSGKQLGERTAFSMEAPKGLAAKWANNLSDYKAPIAELEKRVTGASNNIYYRARTLEGQAQRGKNRAERAIKRVEKILGKDISPELLAQYMQLKAYEERNAKIERRNGKADASGMTPEDARAIEKTIEDSGVDEAIFEEAAQILWDLQREGLQARVDAGLLDQETANKWMTDEPHHIPWKDAVDPDSGEYVGRRMGASEFDTAEGRKTTASGDPITWMLQEYQDAMTRAAQNRLRSSIANLTRLNGDVGTIYDGIQTDSKGKRSFIKYPKKGSRGTSKVLSIPEGVKIESTVKNDGGMKNVLTFKEGGKTKYLVLNGTLGEAVAGAVTGRTLARPPAWISKTMRFYAATATSLSPAFAARNITADNFDIHNNLIAKYGWVKGEKMFGKVVKEQFLMTKQLGSYIKNGDFKLDKGGKVTDFQKLVEAYEDAGGLIGGMATEGYEATVKKIQADFRAGRNKARSIGKSVATYWTMMQKMSELAPRLAVFKAAMESGMSAKDAAMLSREITVDFNKKGEKTPWFNTLWMFSNSALGANLTQMKGLVGKTGAKLAGGLVMYGFAEGMLEAMMNGDDDEREKEGLASGKDINEYTRQNSLYIRRGDKVFRVNIHMGPFAYAKYFGNVMARTFSGMISPEKAAKELGLTAAEVAASFTGLGNVSGDALVQTAVPTIIQPFVQIATNKDYAGRAIKRAKYTESQPYSSHGRKSTSPVYHWMAKRINEFFGGNDYRKGKFLGEDMDIAPETVKVLTEMVGKNFARDIMEIAETGYKLLSGNAKDLDVRNVPFAGDVVRKQDGNDNRYYENYNRYRDDKHELKKQKGWTTDERRAYLKEHPWLYSAGKPGVTRIDNIVKRIEKLRDVEESDRATEERKAEAKAERRKLQARIIELMKK